MFLSFEPNIFEGSTVRTSAAFGLRSHGFEPRPLASVTPPSPCFLGVPCLPLPPRPVKSSPKVSAVGRGMRTLSPEALGLSFFPPPLPDVCRAGQTPAMYAKAGLPI